MRLLCLGVAAAFLALAMCGSARSQVVINEVCSNPAGIGSDPRYEFVELYGTPGMSLDGYMLAAVFGGGDGSVPPDGIPGPLLAGWTAGDEMPEINQAWSLDGQTVGSNGLFVLYNNNLNNSLIPPKIAAATNRASFAQCNLPVGPTGLSDIRNNGSQNYILMRRRPFHSMSGPVSVYATGYSWHRNINPDVNFDGQIDLNGVGTVIATGLPPAPETPVQSQEPGAPPTPLPVTLEPYQMVDEFGCVDGDGHTYFRNNEQKISDTPGGNPDGICRVAYYGTNPNRGWRIVHVTLQTVRTRMADEEFFYGELDPAAITQMKFISDPLYSGGPTDPNGPHYNVSHVLDPAGTYLFDDVSRVGYHMTPGNFNEVNSTAIGGANITQFRFVRGDFNFDGVVNQADLQLIQSRLGATLDDQIPIVDGRGTTSTADDVSRTAWKWQGRDFNALLAMKNMNTTDGAGGTNAASVTQQDIDAERLIIPCPADFNGVGGVTVQDIFDFLGAWFAALPAADFNHVNGITVQDIFDYLSAWFAGC